MLNHSIPAFRPPPPPEVSNPRKFGFTRAVVVSSIDIVRLPEMRSCFISSTCAMPLFKYFCTSWLNGLSVMVCSVIR
ncbi:hypothetical protein D3C76_1295960 [compost metagenome]